MKKVYYFLALAASIMVLDSCRKEPVPELPKDTTPEGQISFSMTDAAGSLNAPTKAGFDAATRIVMRMRSQKGTETEYRYTRTVAQANQHGTYDDGGNSKPVQYSTVQFEGDNIRYWDDAFGRDAKLSVFAIAIPNQNDQSLLPLDKLSAPDETNSFINSTKWFTETTENENITWTVNTTQQSTETINKEDLTYSNNIQPNGSDGVYTYNFNDDCYTPTLDNEITNLSQLADGVMKFQLKSDSDPTGVGKFNKGHLIFKHALSRITVNIKKGTGFVSGNPFKFLTDTDIKLINFPYTGTLNLETGGWSSTTPGNISRMASKTAESGADYTYYAQVLPGYRFTENGSENVMEFTIDDNTYYITKKMLFEALTKDASSNPINATEVEVESGNQYVEMKQGKNYNLTITVGKKAIDQITATLIDWVPVTGSNTDAFNSYITLSLKEATSIKCSNFDLYRFDANFNQIYTDQNNVTKPNLDNWNGDYTDKADLRETSTGSGIWITNWYFESNKAFYHFRSVDKGMAIQGSTGESSASVNDYFNIYSGPINNSWTASGDPATADISVSVNDGKYNDYHWGAPIRSSATALTYQTTGTDNQLAYGQYIEYAIGSTNSTINIIEQHMMANIHIVLHTGQKADGTNMTGGKVTLRDDSNKATQVTLTNFYGEGTVELGRGLVTPNTNKGLISSDFPIPGQTTTTYDTNHKLSSLVAEGEYYETDGTVSKSYSYRVVPQSLYHGTGDANTDTTLSNFIGLTLVTPDDNQYYIIKSLYDINASTVSTQAGKTEQSQNQPIRYWYPGYDYTYHIYINKKGIDAITCSVVDWVNVVGTNHDIDLED